MRWPLAFSVCLACSSPTTATKATPPVAPVVAEPDPPFPPAVPDEVCQKGAVPDYVSNEHFGDGMRVLTGKNACAVADNNLARDEAAILAAAPAAATASKPWDHKSKVVRMDLVQRRFALGKPELAMVEQNGFAVLGDVELPSYTHGYHEIFQSELPVYITADSIFHAIFASHDDVVASLERSRLAPLLDQALDELHCALPAAANDYPRDVARDLDLYLIVARSLAGDDQVKSKLGDVENDRDAAALIAKVRAADALSTVTMFGRPRSVDFTQFKPRGHYAKEEPLQHYFRAAMWASRVELNLVSRSSRSSAPTEPDPSETPREALVALALADLAKRSGADARIATIDQAWSLLAGRREDVTIAQLGELRAKAGITSLRDPHAFDALKAAIGDGFQRTTRVHPMPEGSRILPAIATMIGPRIVADATAIMPLVHSAVPDRHKLGIADVAYAMGLDHAKLYLATDLAKFPRLEGQLELARQQIAATRQPDDLYGAWFAAIHALAVPPTGATPSFLTTKPGKDLRLDSIAAAYGQLKHNYVLMAGQPYAEFGCEIPDGYVEPVPAAYRGLELYAKRGIQLAALVDPNDALHIKAHYARVAEIMRLLQRIADDELANRPVTETQKRWLGMVAELSLSPEEVTGHPPQYTGWYFDLFYARQEDGMRGTGFIADYFTSQEGIAYVGASSPHMAVFVVDSNGAPRAFAGPVARAFEVHGPLATRLTDETAATANVDDPWAKSYTVTAAPSPQSLKIAYDPEKGIVVTTDRDLGAATVKLLDHHRVPLATRQTTLKNGATVVPLRNKAAGAIYIEIGAFRGWAVADGYGQIGEAWGDARPAPEE